MKPVFEPSEFYLNGFPMEPVEAATYANAKIQKLIDEAEVVYGESVKFLTSDLKTCDKVKGYVLFVEPIKKECVRHMPTSGYSLGIAETINPVCINCGVRLEMTWTERK
jgi:hypothetical protein